MNSVQLFTKRNDGLAESGLWLCGKCRRLFGYYNDAGKEESEACCVPKYCQKHDKKLGDSDHCHQCWIEKHREKERQKLEAAEIVEYEGGLVYLGNYGDREGWFDSPADLAEWWSEEAINEETGEPMPPPEFAFASKEDKRFQMDIDDVLDNECEDMFEEAVEHLQGVGELRAAVLKFNEINKGLVSYQPDFDRKVRIPPVG